MATFPLDRDDRETLEIMFTYHAPKPGQQERYVALRAKALELATLIFEEVPLSAERETALMFLDSAIFNANAAIARWDE